MNVIGSGFIVILNYASYGGGAEDANTIDTETGQNILTEDSKDLLIES